MASFSNAEKVLAVLLAFGFIVGFILTPLGVETRMNELRTLDSVPERTLTVPVSYPAIEVLATAQAERMRALSAGRA